MTLLDFDPYGGSQTAVLQLSLLHPAGAGGPLVPLAVSAVFIIAGRRPEVVRVIARRADEPAG